MAKSATPNRRKTDKVPMPSPKGGNPLNHPEPVPAKTILHSAYRGKQ